LKQRIEIGFVVIMPNGKPHTGVHHAGPKVYKTRNLADAAVRNRKDEKGKFIQYEIVPAFVEIEAGVPDGNQS
jgi:hypothetical protein